jgi:dolichyl-phosphate-mannose-protein mannosyltransferase
VTSSAAPLLAAPRLSAYERWRARLERDPRLRRRYDWLAPALVTLVAAVLRLWNLGHPHELVFDETYYVKDAWSQWNLGYAATWPEGADERFADGDTDIFHTAGSYVVHPPLGKFFIGLGMALFGADSSFGWRVAVAVFGTATVLVLYFLARTVTGSLVAATVASGLLAVDGLGIAMSRVGLLDGILAFFVVLAFWFAALDRRAHPARLTAGVAARTPDAGPPVWGPVLWHRPWLVAAGAAAGAASAVKWSGVWVLAAIGLFVVVTDALERRRLGVAMWPTDAVRQGAASFLLLVPVAAVVYVASWTGWLTSDGGYDRHAADAAPASGLLSFVPLALQSLWRYHETIYASMVAMTSEHSYASPAWQWPLLWRPTSMYAHSTADGVDGCAGGEHGCLQALYSMPNPLLWYAAVAAAAYLAYRLVVTRDGRDAVLLTAVAATWLPWLAYPERTIFQFYTIVLWPFLLVALAVALRDAVGPLHAPPERRRTGRRVVLVFLAVALVLSAFWYPLWSAIQVPYDFYRLHNWLPGWV